MKKKVLLAVLTVLTALYFRIPFWTDLPPQLRQLNRERAEMIVRKNMAQTVTGIASFPPAVSEAEREEIIQKKVQEFIDAEPDQYESLVSSFRGHLDRSAGRRYSKDYLPEIDTYYYLLLTKNILRSGAPGPSGHNGTFFDPLRCAPAGSWDRVTWHPYLGAAAYRVMRFFDKNISLVRAVAWVPVFLSVLIALAALFLFSVLDVRPFLAFLGSTVFLLSPFVVLRSYYGWYDTDPYIFIFSALAFASLMLAIKKPRRSLLCGAGGGLSTGLLALFWPGWLSVVPFVMSGAAGLAVWDLFKKKKGAWEKGPVWYLVAYTAATLLLVVVFLSPQSLAWTIKSGLSLFMKTGGGGSEPWPNLLLLISETGQMTAARWFSLTLSFGALVFSFLGAAAAGAHFLKAKEPLRFRQWLAVLSICVPALVLSFHGKRFVLSVVLPLSMMAVFGMEWFMVFLKRKIEKITKKPLHPLWPALAVLLCVLPVTVADAWTTSQESNVVMDDPWFKVLNFLREKTPRDSIVFSWWSPGYFISGLAERRTAIDGGTQTRPENLWIAKALMRRDEREAVGIFRMLALSGSGALTFLQKHGMKNDEAIALIMKILSLGRGKAGEVLPGAWPEQEKKDLLDIVFGKSAPPPAYVVVYTDLVASNVVLQQSDRWNFKKAEKVFKMKMPPGRPGEARDSRMAEYFRRVSAIAGDPIPYQRPEPPFHRDQGLLFYKNLVIDETKKEAFLSQGGKNGVETEPVPLMYLEEGKWVTKAPSGPSPALWAVWFNTPGSKGYPKAMLARKELLESLLFRLYYFRGQDCRWIRPVAEGGGPDDVNDVAAFEIDLASFDRPDGPGAS